MKKSILITALQIAEALKTPPAQGKHALEPFKSDFVKPNSLPFEILEDSAVANNKVELHMDVEDVWVCLEGEAWFLLGGEMVDPKPSESGGPRELRSKEVHGAERIVMKPGDWLWIPAGVPHVHGAEQTARLMVLKRKP